MCGIAGLIDPTLAAEALARTAAAMGAALAHRGPDGEGLWCDPEAGVALAHRRLAIVELSDAGAQPMVCADGRWIVTYNGEIYDAPGHRPALERAGHVFAGGSDTEVLVELIARRGVREALEALDGIFAFAAWDRRERRLWLARDRFGVKPLYVALAPERLLFGSELKALMAHPGFERRVDPAAVATMLRFGFVPAPWTVFAGVEKLGPGEILAWRPGEEPRREVFWSVAEAMRRGAERPFAGDDGEAVEALEGFLGAAVRRQLMSDRPLGAFLSGGIDSGSVAAFMAQAADRPRTFTIGFDDPSLDESRHAEAVARHLGTEHATIVVGEREALDVVPKLADMFDEPFADSSQVPTHVVSAATRRHVTVALSGDGGDELFGGYERYALSQRFSERVEPVPLPLRRAVATTVRRLPGPAIAALAQAMPAAWRGPEPADRLRKVADVLPLDALGIHRRLLTLNPDAEALARGVAPRSGPLDGEGEPAGATLLDRMRLRDCRGYLPDDILTKVDRASMAVGLETRVPFLDRAIAEFAWSLPGRFLVRDGEAKWILRQVLARHVPCRLWQRPKQGFAVPLARWLRGPLRDWARDLVESPDLGGGLVDQGLVRQKLREHLSGARNHAHGLWAILMFESWRRRWA